MAGDRTGGLRGAGNFPTITGKVCLISQHVPPAPPDSGTQASFPPTDFVAQKLMNEVRHASCHGKQPLRYWSPVPSSGAEQMVGCCIAGTEAFIFLYMNFIMAGFLFRSGPSPGRAQPQPGLLRGETLVCNSVSLLPNICHGFLEASKEMEEQETFFKWSLW